jgi:hypothetical protein
MSLKDRFYGDFAGKSMFEKAVLIIAAIFFVSATGFAVFQSCGGEGQNVSIDAGGENGTQTPPPAPTPNPNPNPGPAPTPCKVSYNPQVKALISQSCGPKCHGEFTEYATAKDYQPKMLERIRLSDPNLHMPKPNNFGYGEPSAQQVLDLEAWGSAGFPENPDDCAQGGGQGGSGFKSLEDELREANRAVDDEDNQNDIRFAVANHITNRASFTGEDVRMYWAAVNKTLNSLARGQRDIIKCQVLDAEGSICKLSLSAYGLTAADWDAILREEPFNFPINGSALGRDLIAKTGTAQPFLHADVLAEFAMRPRAYHQIADIAPTLAEFQKQVGSNIAGDIKEQANIWTTNRRQIGKVIFAATKDTAISDSNRQVILFESKIDKCAITFDVIDGNADNKNLLVSPLQVVGKHQYQPDGSEVFCLDENGMMFGALYNGAGERADVAPTNLVIDFETKLQAKDIFNFGPCMGCHQKGLRPIIDTIRDAYNADPDDAFLVQGLYGTQVQINAFINDFNAKYQAALAKIGISPSDPDPNRYTREKLLVSWTFDQFCAFWMQEETECKRKFDISIQTRSKLAGLRNGGTATFAEIVEAAPDTIREFQIGQDEIR